MHAGINIAIDLHNISDRVCGIRNGLSLMNEHPSH